MLTNPETNPVKSRRQFHKNNAHNDTDFFQNYFSFQELINRFLAISNKSKHGFGGIYKNQIASFTK